MKISIDSLGDYPDDGTPVASSTGPGILIDVSEDGENFLVDHELTEGPPNLAKRISASMYEKQQTAMLQLVAKVEQHWEGIDWRGMFELGKKTFHTLELVMAVRHEGLYIGKYHRNTETGKDEHHNFEPFANPKNEALIVECVPFFWGVDKRSIVKSPEETGFSWDILAREKYQKLKTQLGLEDQELLDALDLITNKKCEYNTRKPLGGCYFCKTECH